MKVAICGTHCSGKSTLVNQLKNKLNHPIIQEIAGNYTEKQRKDLLTQFNILSDQIKVEQTMKKFISDRSVIDNLSYIKFHSLKNNIPEVYEVAKSIINLYLITHPYDAIFFIGEYFPLVDDGIRNLDINQQEFIFKTLSEIAPTLCKDHNIPIIYITGTTQERSEEISSWLTQHQL